MLNTHADVRVAFAVNAGRPRAPDTVTAWRTVRRAADTTETILRQRTFRWLATLPASDRPMATARQYPRIANRIGDLWSHCEYTRLYLQSLLIDRRGGRKGLPSEVKREIERLQRYYFENLSGLPAVLWNAVPLMEPKIPQKVFPPIYKSAEIELRPLPE